MLEKITGNFITVFVNLSLVHMFKYSPCLCLGLANNFFRTGSVKRKKNYAYVVKADEVGGACSPNGGKQKCL
jgi:hypothetical protein